MFSTAQIGGIRAPLHAHTSRAGRAAGICTIVCFVALCAGLLGAGAADAAEAPVGLGTADAFALLAGSSITNTGPSVVTGDLGLHPGTSVTGFGGAPDGIVNGTKHITDAVALQAKADLVTAYNDAAGRTSGATLLPDTGGATLTPGVYRTGGVGTLGLTGNLTLDAQGDSGAVFIFQVASSLTTATDSSVSLINGAQSCNVFWQIGASATLGTRTAFRGNLLAMTSITLNDAVSVDGRLLARDGAETLINNVVTRPTCATVTPVTGTGGTGGTGATGGTGTTGGTAGTGGRGSDVAGGGGTPDRRRPSTQISTGPLGSCTTHNFTATVRVRDKSGIRSVKVYLDGRLVRSARSSVKLVVNIHGLRVGRHRLRVVAVDKRGNKAIVVRRFRRCAAVLAVPHYTG